MCTQKKPYNWSGRLYAQFKQSISNYLKEKVFRSLRSKSGEDQLRELVRRWRNHQVRCSGGWLRELKRLSCQRNSQTHSRCTHSCDAVVAHLKTCDLSPYRQVMTKWLVRFFSYLDRFYVKRLALPRLNKVAVDCFRELVFMPCSESICDSFIGMMTRERRGVS